MKIKTVLKKIGKIIGYYCTPWHVHYGKSLVESEEENAGKEN